MLPADPAAWGTPHQRAALGRSFPPHSSARIPARRKLRRVGQPARRTIGSYRQLTVNFSLLVAAPFGVVTATLPVFAPVGTAA